MTKFFLIVSVLLGFSVMATSSHFWRGEVLSIAKVKEKWGGAQKFEAKKFKLSSMDERAKMAFDLLSKKREFKGLSVVDLTKKIGSPDGFYFSDTIPAYMIHQAKTKEDDSWQIVFMLNNDGKVSDIFVHKNCCD